MTAPTASWDAIAAGGAVHFALDDTDFTIGELPLRIWGPALTSGDLEDIVPGLLPGEQYEAWVEAFWDPERIFTQALHRRIVDHVIAAAAGMPAAACLRLVLSVQGHWREFDGWAAARRLDLLDLPLHRFCNLVYQRIVSNMAEKDRVVFDADLFAPPPDADPDSPDAPPGWAEADTGDLFAAAMAGFAATKGAPTPQVR